MISHTVLYFYFHIPNLLERNVEKINIPELFKFQKKILFVGNDQASELL